MEGLRIVNTRAACQRPAQVGDRTGQAAAMVRVSSPVLPHNHETLTGPQLHHTAAAGVHMPAGAATLRDGRVGQCRGAVLASAAAATAHVRTRWTGSQITLTALAGRPTCTACVRWRVSASCVWPWCKYDGLRECDQCSVGSVSCCNSCIRGSNAARGARYVRSCCPSMSTTSADVRPTVTRDARPLGPRQTRECAPQGQVEASSGLGRRNIRPALQSAGQRGLVQPRISANGHRGGSQCMA